MDKLLETQELRKISILFELTLDSSPIRIEVLAQRLKISQQTLLTTLKEINQDAQYFRKKLEIKLYSKHEIILETESNFYIFSYGFNYIKESILYQLLDQTFKNKFTTVQEMADVLHISIASLYRKLSNLRTLLNGFNLDFDSQHLFPILGSEKQLRFFFYFFYWQTYKHSNWPFDEKLKSVCTEIYQNHIEHFVTFSNPLIKEKLILLFAINLFRHQSGYFLEETEVLDMKEYLQQNPYFETLANQIQHFLNQKNYTLDDSSYFLIFTLMICDESYLPTGNFNPFLLMPKKRMAAEEATILLLQRLPKLLNRPLLDKEVQLLYENFFKIHLLSYFFTEKITFFKQERHYPYIKQRYASYQGISLTLNQEISKLGKPYTFLKENPNLSDGYLWILIDHLDAQAFQPELEIAFLLGGLSCDNFYQRKFQSLVESPIKFVTQVTPKTDLIISNTPLFQAYEIPYFILTFPMTEWNWNLVKRKLEQLIQAKLPSS